jgi:MFS family permease
MWIGACTAQIGTQMRTAAQSWLVLDLSRDNSFFLGVDQFLGQIPIVLFSLLAGVLADRHDRRKVLLGSQYLQMTSAFLLAALAFSGIVKVWQVWCISFVVGTAQAFGGPAYSALIPSLVPRDHIRNAVALNSVQFNLARVIGPTIAGVALITLGAAWCFGLNGVTFVVVIITLYLVKAGFVPARSSEPFLASMKAGIKFITGQPAMKELIILAFLMNMLGFQVLTFAPVFARTVYHAGPQAFTLMLSCSGAGAVAGGLFVAALGKAKQQGRSLLLAFAVFGILTIGFALSPNIFLSCVMIFLTGAALMAVLSMSTSLVQTIAPDHIRGRVMSVLNLASRGGLPVGALIAGALIPVYTVPVVIAGAGVLMVCLALYFLLIDRRVASL